MPGENETTTKFKVDISELKQGIQQAKQEIRLASAEFKSAASGMDNWATSSDGIKAKLKQLETTLKSQKTILENLEDQYAQVAAEQGESSKGATNLKIAIENQKAAINNTEKSLNDYENRLSDVEAAEDEAARTGRDVEDVLRDMDDASNEAAGGFTVLKGALANLVADGIRAAISALQDFAKETINVGKDFDSSMSEVAAISGATSEELQTLRDTAKEFGSSTVFSSSEAADALKYMALAGWDTEQSVSALGGILDLAAASGMELGKASDMVTDYLTAFGMEAEQSAYFADLLAFAQSNSNTSAEQLGEAYKNCAANMSAAGQDVETTTALLAMMANQGLKGSEAGTALTAVMRDMTAKMSDGNIMIGETAVQVQDANGNYRDLTDILKDVEAATNGMGDAERATALMSTFTSDSIKGLNLMLNAGVGEAASFEEALRGSEGTAGEMAATMNDNLNGDLANFNSQLEGVQIAIYEKFEPALRQGVEALSGLLDGVSWVVDHSTEFIAGIAAMGAGVAAYVAYTTALNIMKNGWQSLAIVQKAVAAGQAVLNAVMAANPIGLVIAAIAALVAAFVILWNNSEAFREFWIGLWETIQSAVQPVIEAIVTYFTELWENVKTIFEPVVQFFIDTWNGIVESLLPVIESIKTAFTEAWELIKVIWDIVKPYFEDIWTTIKSIFSVVKEVLGGFFKVAWIAIKGVWDVVVLYFKTIWENIKTIFSVVIDVLGNFFKLAWEGIKAVWDVVTGYFKAVWDTIAGIFSVVRNVLTGNWRDAWDGIKGIVGTWVNYFKDVWNSIKGVFGAVVTFFKTTFSDAWKGIKEIFSNWATFFTDLWDTITGIFSEVGTAISDAISGSVKAAVNAVLNGAIGIINGFVRAINGVLSVINAIPGVSISKLSELDVPQLATGGVLAKGQVGLLEGDGAEAVVPLDQNKKWIRKTAQDLKREMSNEGIVGGGVANSGNVVNNYNFTQNNTSPKALSRLEIYRQTKNQLAFAKGV